jgi:UDP-N-acetylglucosamine:LPS N-acetylglucosamine transferase
MRKICLVCSSGGHLFQLYSLKDFWSGKDRFWVSFPTSDAKYLLSNEKKYWAHYPTNRNVKNLVKNLFLAVKILKKERPDLIISTGAGVAVPFIFLGRIFRMKTIFLESITRNEELSLSARLVYPYVNKLLVQWPELEHKYKKVEFHGQVL